MALAIQTTISLKLAAQIVTDGSMGAAMNLSGPNFQIPETLGTRVGGNLFHSFQRLDIGQGERATFTGEPGIQNILARITGGTPSNINGTLASEIPGANLYLMNPAGFLFGPGAALDVQGNFAVTSADQITDPRGAAFKAESAAIVPLTFASPAAFGFLNADPQPIVFAGSRMAVPTAKEMVAVAGGLEFRDSADVSAPSGTIRLASIEASGSLDLGSFDTDSIQELGDITITGGAQVKASGSSSGNLFVKGLTLTINGSTANRFSSLRNETIGSGNGGTIEVDVRDRLLLDRGTIVAQNLESSSGKGSGIEISAGRVVLRNTGRLVTTTFGDADSGSIVITADLIDLAERDLLDPVASPSNPNTGIRAGTVWNGDSGRIELRAGIVRIADGASLNSASFDYGHAGSIEVIADSLEVSNGTINASADSLGSAGSVSLSARQVGMLQAQVRTTSRRTDAGSIRIDADQLHLTKSTIAASGFSIGGDIEINSKGVLMIEGAYNDGISIFSETRTPLTVGRAGNLSVRAGEAHVLNGGQIRSTTSGGGNAGDVTVDIGGQLVMDGGISGMVTLIDASSGNARGNSGNVQVSSAAISIINGAQIRSVTAGAGRSGDVAVIAQGNLRIDGGASQFARFETGIFSQSINNFQIINGVLVQNPSTGSAGSVSVEAGSVQVLNRGQISSQSFGLGNAGGLRVEVDGMLTIDGRTDTVFETGLMARSNQGTTGDIHVRSGAIELRRGGIIDNSVIGLGASGSIRLAADQGIRIDGGDFLRLQAGVYSGRPLAGRLNRGAAGSIEILSNGLTIERGGIVSSSSLSGDAGSVTVFSGSTPIELDRGTISVSGLAANAGQISLNSGADIIAKGSTLSAIAFNDGGDVFLNGRFIRVVDGSQLVANAIRGQGGRFRLNSLLFVNPNSPMPRVDSQQGDAGFVDVRNAVDLQSTLAELPEGLLSDRVSIGLGCERDRPSASSLNFTGLLGRADSPGLWQPGMHFEAPTP